METDIYTDRKKPIIFPDGSYIIEGKEDTEFLNAIKNFRDEVIDKIKILQPIIYVYGSADILGATTFNAVYQEFSCGNEIPSENLYYHPKYKNFTDKYFYNQNKKGSV